MNIVKKTLCAVVTTFLLAGILFVCSQNTVNAQSEHTEEAEQAASRDGSLSPRPRVT